MEHNIIQHSQYSLNDAILLIIDFPSESCGLLCHMNKQDVEVSCIGALIIFLNYNSNITIESNWSTVKACTNESLIYMGNVYYDIIFNKRPIGLNGHLSINKY